MGKRFKSDSQKMYRKVIKPDDENGFFFNFTTDVVRARGEFKIFNTRRIPIELICAL